MQPPKWPGHQSQPGAAIKEGQLSVNSSVGLPWDAAQGHAGGAGGQFGMGSEEGAGRRGIRFYVRSEASVSAGEKPGTTRISL